MCALSMLGLHVSECVHSISCLLTFAQLCASILSNMISVSDVCMRGGVTCIYLWRFGGQTHSVCVCVCVGCHAASIVLSKSRAFKV